MKEQTIENQMGDSPERRAFEIRRRIDKLLHGLLEILWEEQAESDNPKLNFIASVKGKIADLIPEASESVGRAFDKLVDSEANERTKLLTQTEAIVISLLAEYLTLPELEKRLKSRQREEQHEELSRGLESEIKGNRILLHIPVTFFSSPKEALQSFMIGFQKLAEKIKTEEKYKAATEITGISELVKEKPKLFAKYGFTVVLDELGNPSDEATMSVEQFLQIYGK